MNPYCVRVFWTSIFNCLSLIVCIYRRRHISVGADSHSSILPCYLGLSLCMASVLPSPPSSCNRPRRLLFFASTYQCQTSLEAGTPPRLFTRLHGSYRQVALTQYKLRVLRHPKGEDPHGRCSEQAARLPPRLLLSSPSVRCGVRVKTLLFARCAVVQRSPESQKTSFRLPKRQPQSSPLPEVLLEAFFELCLSFIFLLPAASAFASFSILSAWPGLVSFGTVSCPSSWIKACSLRKHAVALSACLRESSAWMIKAEFLGAW
jgi:hypothetical protein